jgi:hypothetical protein
VPCHPLFKFYNTIGYTISTVIRLRGHHLICLHFFSGEGYSDDFKAALRALLKRAEAGEAVEVATGADDLCHECPYLEKGRCVYAEGADEEIRAMDDKALELLGMEPGAHVRWPEIREKLPAVFRQWARFYCAGCTWKRTCLENPLWKSLSNRG